LGDSGDGKRPALIAVSGRVVLRWGYAAVIGLLVFASLQAYRIQVNVSEQHVDIYRQYALEDKAISSLRRDVWLAGNFARDFFISSDPERGRLLRSQVQALESESLQAMAEFERIRPHAEPTLRVKADLKEYWRVLSEVPETMSEASQSAAYAFVQEELVPRRSVLYEALRGMTEADQARLQESEAAYVTMRREAIRKLLAMLALCVLLAFLVARFSLQYAARLERESDRQFDEVAQAKLELEQLSARLLEIEEDGRRRLSRELHDSIGQSLAVLQMELSHVQALMSEGQPRVRERLLRARELAENTVQTVRNITLLLRPALLDDLGLVPALQWLLEDFQRRSGVTCEFSESGVEELLPDPVKTCVYRVIQEALHNCEKHSGATQVRVSVRQTPGLLSAWIEDNGRGVELNPKGMPQRSAGLGILGMRERAARIGAAIALQSTRGLGTQICLQVPLAQVAAEESGSLVPESGDTNAYTHPVGG